MRLEHLRGTYCLVLLHYVFLACRLEPGWIVALLSWLVLLCPESDFPVLTEQFIPLQKLIVLEVSQFLFYLLTKCVSSEIYR